MFLCKMGLLQLFVSVKKKNHESGIWFGCYFNEEKGEGEFTSYCSCDLTDVTYGQIRNQKFNSALDKKNQFFSGIHFNGVI